MKDLLLIGMVAIALAAFVDADKSSIASGCNCDDKKTIVNRHNELRKSLATGSLPDQPKASNMQTMVWDDNLQAVAQSWADRMVFEHNKDVSDCRFKHVGENIYTSFYSEPDATPEWKRAIQSWFDENTKFDYTNVKSFHGAGHFTQLIWADTTYVGCGFAYYEDSAMGMFTKLYVCDYGPGGNIHGQSPYETGPGCEDLCCKDQCNGNMFGDSCV